ncbi:hypothetical protein UNDKW_3357 [Undibacterium sp. KW1]|uniref:hypothetical protein n=1 Tax=Undibacterium sp. KW1 TaxID=2058624 RepID=UPI001331EE4C|nr:hypothetical protein [Undibacterium sp. KW1]BBB61630.1 hypothetical protein UNDKW_3357 [Undibacterium sp. KW1]
MSGLFFLGIAAIWLILAAGISIFITEKIQLKSFEGLFALVLFLLIFPLPIADEIVGRREFDRLCAEKASSINWNREKLRGGTVYFVDVEPTKNVKGRVTNDEIIAELWIPIWQRTSRFVDIKNEVVVDYKELYTGGGWVARWINFNSANTPLTFKGFCQPDESSKSSFELLQITVKDKSKEPSFKGMK